jgi:hypothetical protein
MAGCRAEICTGRVVAAGGYWFVTELIKLEGMGENERAGHDGSKQVLLHP